MKRLILIAMVVLLSASICSTGTRLLQWVIMTMMGIVILTMLRASYKTLAGASSIIPVHQMVLHLYLRQVRRIDSPRR